jgi:hypothetical protein
MKAINIAPHLEDASQIENIKAVVNAFKIKYTINKAKEADSPNKPDFVAMIKQGEKDLNNGKGSSLTMEDLEKVYK